MTYFFIVIYALTDNVIILSFIVHIT